MAWYADFGHIIRSEESAEDFLKSRGILGTRAPTCLEDGCGRTMTRISKQGRFVWCCPDHKKKNISCRTGTFLERQKLSNVQFILICNAWADMETIQKAQQKTGLGEKTVLQWYQHFRDVCSQKLVSVTEKIGGPGLTVEIDESVIAKRKHNRGRTVKERWVFGGICVETDEMFMLQVERRDAQTLLPILEANVAPGSIIHSDGWAAYQGIAAMPVNPRFTHLAVNHKENFVDPNTGACTNHVERMWGGVKSKFKRMNGCMSSTLPSHLDEAMWRYQYSRKGEQPFQHILDHIAEQYPVD